MGAPSSLVTLPLSSATSTRMLHLTPGYHLLVPQRSSPARRAASSPLSWPNCCTACALRGHCVHTAHAEAGILTPEYLSPDWLHSEAAKPT